MSATQDRASDHRFLTVAACVLVPALTFLAFLPVLDAGWLNWDDDINFLGNPHWRGVAAENIRWMFGTTFVGHYQPASWLSLAVDYELWGMEPEGYHLTNLLVHAAAAVLLFFLVRRLLSLAAPEPAGASPIALSLSAACCALAFSVHPLRVENVAWITERRDVLSAFFLLAAALAYLRAVCTCARRRWLAASVLLYVLSLLSKSIGMTFPFVLLILDVYPLRRLPPNPLRWILRINRPALLEKLPFLVAAVLALVLAVIAQRQYLHELASLGIPYRVAVAAYAVVFYVRKTLLPVGLLPLYQLPRNFVGFLPAAIASAAAALAITIAVILARRRAPWAVAAWTGYLVLLSPVSGVLQSGPQLVADRYGYLSCMPFAILVGALILHLLCDGRETLRPGLLPILALGVAAFVLATLALLTYRQTKVWRSSLALWSHVVRHDPQSTIAHLNIGNALREAGDFDAAVSHYEQAIALKSNLPELYNNLGNALRRKGDLEAAIRSYRKAVALKDDYANAHYNLANAAFAARDLETAASSYERSLELDPENLNAWFNLGNVRALLGDVVGSSAAYEEVLRRNPGDAEARKRIEILKSGR